MIRKLGRFGMMKIPSGFFSVLDIIVVLNDYEDYTKARNYWKYHKAKLKKSNPQLVSGTTQLKLTAVDGKKYRSDALDSDGVIELAKSFPNTKAIKFLDWFLYSENTLDGQSKKKAYTLYESGMLASLEPRSIKCLQQIHGFIFGGLYDFAGQIRNKNISKGGFTFANVLYFSTILKNIEVMPETTFDEIVNKYVEMNVAHPFMEGNGRSTRIWLDLMLKRSLKKCVDWSKINKNDYLQAMTQSVTNSTLIRELLVNSLTNKINDREMFMKGIDYSYYYETDNTIDIPLPESIDN